MDGALSSVLVLDLGRVVSAPTCCFYLASLGATVVRVEQPGGDMSWHVPPYVGPGRVQRGIRDPDDIPIAQMKRGRGKRSVVIDFRQEEGRGLFRRLGGRADVVVENFRPGILDDLGIGYRDLQPSNAGLVWCAITGYGQDGPDRATQGMDLVVQARSGLMAKTGFADGPPTKVGFMAGDQVPAAFSTVAILAALRERDRSGEGRFIDMAMLDVLAAMIWDEPLDLYEDEGRPQRSGSADPRGVPHDVFATSDGWVAIVVTSHPQWARLCALMGRPELAVELDTLAKRLAASDRVNGAVAGWAAQHPAEWLGDRLAEAQVPGSAVRPPGAGCTDRALRHRGLFEPLRHPGAPGWESPFVGARMPLPADMVVPTSPAEPLGAGTDAVLADLLGLGPDEIAGLHERGVVRSTHDA